MQNKFWWIVGVAIITAVAFFIPERTGEIWTSILSALVVVGIFYVGLLFYIFKHGKSTTDKIVGVGVIILLTSLIVAHGILQYRGATFQHRTLPKIRASIEKGIISTRGQQPFLRTLQAYHAGTADQDSTLEDLFKARYADNIQHDSELIRFVPDAQKENSDKSPFLYYKETGSRNKLVLVGQSLLVEGQDSTFRNYNGQKGLLQYRITLTKKGVDYVREN